MFLAALALAAALDLNARPADLVRPGEAATYAARLDEFLDRALETGHDGRCAPGSSAQALGPTPLGRADAVLHVQPGADIPAEAIVYKERFEVTGCGAAQQANILSVRERSGDWYMAAFLPGETEVSPELFHDLGPQVLQAAIEGQPRGDACANGDDRLYRLLDTELVGPDPKPDASGARHWQEHWVQRACGQDRSVLIDFTSRPGEPTRFAVTPDWESAATVAEATAGARPHP